MALFGKKLHAQDESSGAETSWRESQAKSIAAKFGKSLHPDAIQQYLDNILPREEIEVVIPGTADSAMFATQYRVFVYKRGGAGGVLGGSKMVTWDPDEIHGVQFEFGKLSGLVAIMTPSAPASDMSYWDSGGSSPQKLPNAIAIIDKEPAYEATIDFRHYLFTRKHPELSLSWETEQN